MSWRGWAAGVVMAGGVAVVGAAALGDWSSFRGPNLDGTTGESVNWSASGPKQLWKVPLGPGLGTFAVAGDKAFVMAGDGDPASANGRLNNNGKGKRGGQEGCVALDLKTGKKLWATPIGETIFETQGDHGPRTSPAVDGDKVYVTGTFLAVACLDAKTGKTVWGHDLVKDFAGQGDTPGIGNWGNAASPVVDGKHVYVYGGGPGQTFLAFDKVTGKVAWKSGTEKITHASPAVGTIHGVRQVIYFCQSGLVSVDAETGNELWKFPFKFSVSTASTPIVAGDLVYCSAGYGVGAGLARIEKQGNKFTATEVWKKPGKLINHWTTPVYKDGHLYGIYGFKDFGKAPLQCVELASGEVKWSRDGFGPGGTILAGDLLISQGDRGQIVAAKATPDKYTEVGTIQPLGGKCWNMAVVANGRLLARSTTEGVCLDVSK